MIFNLIADVSTRKISTGLKKEFLKKLLLDKNF